MAGRLLAGTGRAEITNRDAGPVHDPLWAKALVLRNGDADVVLLTLDAVAIEEIGPIRHGFLAGLRGRLQSELGIAPESVLVNASHCHGAVCAEVAERACAAVRDAVGSLAPVRVGAGVGHEDRISENRRMRLQDGREADVRHAYGLPPDAAVTTVGPIDPQIGVLRLDRDDGRPLAVLHTFSCHPIQGVPGGGTTADISGLASAAMEAALGEGSMALFLQGCAGDINPVFYKAADLPRNAEPLGNMLAMSTLQARQRIVCSDNAALRTIHTRLALPRANLAPRLAALEAEQTRLLRSLRGTTLNLKTFVPLLVKYALDPAHPSYYAHRYLHEAAMGWNDLGHLEAGNRRDLEQYIRNVQIMEELTRVQTNLALLQRHHDRNAAAGFADVVAEVVGVRVGDFVLVTFPGELSVEIGLGIKGASPHPLTFVAGITNGYLYYAPTAAQLRNPGCAQEDCDCLLAPEWQQRFEEHVHGILSRL